MDIHMVDKDQDMRMCFFCFYMNYITFPGDWEVEK
jgi:hypothetical protein